MPVESSADTKTSPAIDIPLSHRFKMVGLAYIPLLHSALIVGLVLASVYNTAIWWLPMAAVGAIYLLPPLAVLPLRVRKRLDVSPCPLRSTEFLLWWYAAQWQVVFNRLPFLEELLRLVPGLYSVWLRLWGAKIGKLVYWSPGLRISDRPFIEIGDRTVLGLDAKLYAHFITKTRDGESNLFLSPIRIGHDVLIGGCTLLPAGVEIASCEQTPAARPLAPFGRFADGRHTRTTRFHMEESHA